MPTNLLKLNLVYPSKQGINLKYHANLLVADIFGASEAYCLMLIDRLQPQIYVERALNRGVG
jgi:hypothetical protein